MESLAKNENKRKAIAVILSGGSKDGVSGAAAIKKAGGLVIVQAPETCVFKTLPETVITNGDADFVVEPQHMPKIIHDYVIKFHNSEAY